MKKEFAARRLDVQAFAREAGALVGADGLQAHERLMAETQGAGGEQPVAWSARGELRHAPGGTPQVWLHLAAQTRLPLVCQRCLGTVEVPVEVDRWFRFVASEEQAQAEDDQAEEDLLALDRAFDLVELVEDELLMEMPVAPRHEVCPDPVKLVAADPGFADPQAARPNPFAVLQKLRPGKGS